MDNNPFNNLFNEREAFGLSRDQNDREKVCPTCGTPLMGRENYCMGCGMNVEPIDKATYDHLKNEQSQDFSQMQGADQKMQGADSKMQGTDPNLILSQQPNDNMHQGQSTYQGQNTYQSQNTHQGQDVLMGENNGQSKDTFQNQDMNWDQTPPQNPGGNGYRSATRAVVRQESGLGRNLVYVIMALAAVAAVFFLVMGIVDSKKENDVVYTRQIVNDSRVVHEVARIYAKGDKIYKIVDEASVDLPEMEQNQIDLFKSYMRKSYESYLEYGFIHLEITQEGKTVTARLEYDNLNLANNMRQMLDLKLIDIGGRNEVTYKDYLSMKRTVKSLIAEGWIRQ